jgi:transcriptional regulator GlxA family with amidase domain
MRQYLELMRHIVEHGTLARTYLKASIESDPISVRGGAVWTSTGVPSGIDLALALVEEDSGAKWCWR